MRENNTLISFSEFKRLVAELIEKRPDISFRFRRMGDLWYHNFVKLRTIQSKELTLFDEVADKEIVFSDLSSIIQFELDTAFQSFEPFVHYEVALRQEFILF